MSRTTRHPRDYLLWDFIKNESGGWSYVPVTDKKQLARARRDQPRHGSYNRYWCKKAHRVGRMEDRCQKAKIMRAVDYDDVEWDNDAYNVEYSFVRWILY